MNGRWNEYLLRLQALAERMAGPENRNPRGIVERGRALVPRTLPETLKRLRWLLVALLVIQGLRIVIPVAQSEWLLYAASAEEEQTKREKLREPLEHYKPILEKGVLGVPPKEQPPQLFGVLGNMALIGGAPEQVQEYAVGASLPSGEKIIRIDVDEVELEKDGEKQTLTVFPELKQR